MSKKPSYEFLVEDCEGIWGSLRVHADTLDAALAQAVEYLEKEETPHGSLDVPFCLTIMDDANPV
jgi:hypothetical protein